MTIPKPPAPRVPLLDPRTGLLAREWHAFLVALCAALGTLDARVTALEP